jgi:NRPS condensation-like uncharacterized protein
MYFVENVKVSIFGAILYKVVQIWPGRFVCKHVTVCPGHIWTTLYLLVSSLNIGDIDLYMKRQSLEL